MLGKHSGRHAFRSRLTELGHNLSDAELNAAFVRFKALADKKKQISSADIDSIVTDEIQMISRKRFQLERVQVLCGDKQVSTATVTITDRGTAFSCSVDPDSHPEHRTEVDVSAFPASQPDVKKSGPAAQANPQAVCAPCTLTACQTGTGPVDAVYKTIDLLLAQVTATSTAASAAALLVSPTVQLMEYTVSSVTAGIDALGEVTVRCKDVRSGVAAAGRAANTDVIVASAQAYLNAINRLFELQGSLPLRQHDNLLVNRDSIVE